ncbi:hypothetical protein GcC1_174037 [Golovinomyces cichoracearum]|uniref:Uncharacterized protein n=1 Tax=Golovinomyces cichoracearum TaxID=62708 RepID=A0A420HQB3_9PEZI|nr:hypothetical protein GcC1_174037 [Golovinomyces cichoracearum]
MEDMANCLLHNYNGHLLFVRNRYHVWYSHVTKGFSRETENYPFDSENFVSPTRYQASSNEILGPFSCSATRSTLSTAASGEYYDASRKVGIKSYSAPLCGGAW